MKRLIILCLSIAICLGLWGCSPVQEAQIVATTLPVYDFTQAICQGTELRVSRLITQEVSCLHDFTLQTNQMRMMESASVTVISGGGLEAFIPEGAMQSKVIDGSAGMELHCGDHADSHQDHHHQEDPHYWLSPAHAKIMAQNICQGLSAQFPEHKAQFEANTEGLLQQLEDLEAYGKETLSQLSCRELITFHDGFSYFAESFGLEILHSMEEEAGSEASAQELIHLIELVEGHALPAVFVEKSGSASAAQIISAETGVAIYSLDMAMAGNSYFDAMYHNINTVKEALG